MRAGLTLLWIGALAVTCAAAVGCGGDDDVDELRERIDQLEAENAKLRGLEDGEAADSLDGLDAADLELLESLPQESPGEMPTERELAGVDIWPSPEPVADTVTEPIPEPTTPESPPIVLPAPPPREDEGSPIEGDAAAGTNTGIGGPGTEIGDLGLPPADDPGRPPVVEPPPAEDTTPAIVEAVVDPPPAVGGPRLAVHRAVLGTDVVGREPVGVAIRFPRAVAKVYCFSEVSVIGTSGPTTLTHRWTLEGEDQGTTELRIGGDRWRTFSNRTVSEKPGRWLVELVDERGVVIETLAFTVE